ncbi:MAG: thiamine pyrophosphate-requiring protein [Chloroflexi bacterium]|nr:thiamine pyrophosphate-requiring protein [Chloroflexota bacterium]
MNGFDFVAQCLKQEGVEWMACFPANPLIEAVAKAGIKPIVFRQERGGIQAADGFSRQMASKGKIGVFASQGGPGVENAFGGIAQAWGDAVPLVYLPGGHGTMRDDIDPGFSAPQNYEHITKVALTVNRIERTSQQVRRVFHAARNGRPGPALLELHGDILSQEVPAEWATYKPTSTIKTAPNVSDVKDAVKQLLAASNPAIWAGQGVLYAGATAELMELAELTQIPVMTTMQAKSAFPDSHPLALGSANRTAPKPVWKWLGDSDTLLAIGSGLTRTNYGIEIPNGKFLIHSTVSAEDINKDYAVDIGIVGDAKLVLQAMIEEVKASIGENGRRGDSATADRVATVRAEWVAEWAPHLATNGSPMNPYRVVAEINKVVDHANTVATHDAGHPRDEVMPFYTATVPHGYIGWGKTTHLGYGIPLMIGAKIADPSKFCMNIMGDAAFGMSGLDIETAVRSGNPITTVVLNNGTMGGYNHHQPTAMETFGAGNQGGDYAKIAEGLGAVGIKVEKPEEVGPAIKRAQQLNSEGTCVLIETKTIQQMEFSQYPDLLK